MSNLKTDSIRIVKGSERYAGATDTELSIDIQLESQQKNYVEKNRTSIINLAQRFDDERQRSDKIRVSGKITNIFENDIVGTSDYNPFLYNLFYVNPEQTVQNGSSFKGYPPADEFLFIRTKISNGHINFISESATTYNWKLYLSYPFENDYDQNLQFEDETTGIVNSFKVSDGVPFIIRNGKNNGKNLIYFYCGFNHNLEVGQFVELKEPISGQDTFEVYSLGDNTFGSESRVFAIYNFGYNGFFNDTVGNFKKVIDINNREETRSLYYCRKHKILSETKDVEISKMGYENNPFFAKTELQYAALTPNNEERLAYKEINQTYSFTFNKDFDIKDLRDNNSLPITKLFVTIVKNGYVGWFNNLTPAGNTTNIEVGWDLNILDSRTTGWWSKLNPDNRDNIPSGSYIRNFRQFFFNKDLEIGTELKGDICEWNEITQLENVLSKTNHKISFNPNHFNDASEGDLYNPNGFFYYPHFDVPIRSMSDYLETGERDKVDLIPDYAFYSDYDEKWIWRDVYDYGFVDSDGNGIDNPFINGSHYPFKEIVFLQTPLFKNINLFTDIILAPNSDNCE
jgi:hypothetical protein